MIVEFTEEELEELVRALDSSLARREEEIVRADARAYREQLIDTSHVLERVRSKLSTDMAPAQAFDS